MSLHVDGSALVRTRPGVGDWTVWAVEHPAGVARLELRGDLTEVVVGDAPTGLDSRVGFTAMACTRDGHALVLAQDAPPALLVSGSGCRTLPREPGAPELLHLSPDDLVLALSCSVLEARPHLLADALQDPAALLDQDPGRLLADLFREVPRGAGAVLRRRPHRPPPEETR